MKTIILDFFDHSYRIVDDVDTTKYVDEIFHPCKRGPILAAVCIPFTEEKEQKVKQTLDTMKARKKDFDKAQYLDACSLTALKR